MNKMKIGRKQISQNSETYFIADIAANHDGSLKELKNLLHYVLRLERCCKVPTF